MTLAMTCRPPATTATEVSSQLVSMPSVSPKVVAPIRRFAPPSPASGEEKMVAPIRRFAPPSPRAGKTLLLAVLGHKLAAQASDVGLDPLQVGLVGTPDPGRVDRVRPHDDRVFAVVGVVALAPADDLEAECFVHAHGVVVGGAHLQSHPFRAHVVGGLDQAGEQDATVAAVLDVAAYSDRGDVGFVVHAPHASVANDAWIEICGVEPRRPLDSALLTEDDIVRARARGQLSVVGVLRPGRGEDLAFDLLDCGDVGLSHELERQRLSYLNHHARAEKACMYSSLRLP